MKIAYNVSGIYTITNKINGKLIVGYGKNVRKRLNWHKCHLRRGRHKNDRLQKSFSAYGEENFEFDLLVECDERFLASEEHYWATILNSHHRDYGFNLLPTHPDDKKSISKRTREKISKVNKDKKFSEEHKKKISEAHKGKILSEKQLDNLKKHNENRVVSEETKLKHRINRLGIKLSKETIDRCKVAQSKRAKQIIICEICNKSVNPFTYSLHHGKNCGIKRVKTKEEKEHLSKVKTGVVNPALWIPILQFDLKNNFIEEFENITKAHQKSKVCKDSIRKQCFANRDGEKYMSPRTKYIWWYKKDYKSKITKLI